MPEGLPPREAALYAVLADADGRVLSRAVLAARTGLDALSARRVDSLVAALRRRLPPGSVVTVRGRGWALVDPDRPPDVHRVGTARKHTGLLPETPRP